MHVHMPACICTCMPHLEGGALHSRREPCMCICIRAHMHARAARAEPALALGEATFACAHACAYMHARICMRICMRCWMATVEAQERAAARPARKIPSPVTSTSDLGQPLLCCSDLM